MVWISKPSMPAEQGLTSCLLSGDAQYVVSTGTGVVSSYAAGQKDLVIIASFLNVTGSSLFTKPQITKPSELRGKVVGSGRPGSITDVMLHYVLKKKLNLDPARDSKVVPLGDGPSILPALEKGVVDGTVLTTPTRLMAKTMGFREMLNFDELGIPYPYVGVSTLKANVKKNPEMTVRFLKDPHRRHPVIQNQQRNQHGRHEKISPAALATIFLPRPTVTSAPRFRKLPILPRTRSGSLST